MRTRLAALPALPPGRTALTAALFQPNGLTATEDTLVHAALRHAGLRNLAVVRDLPNYARLPLESLLYDQPDLLVLNDYEERMPSLAQSLMRHPVLLKSFRNNRRVVVPAQAWSCGTPHYVQAVEILRRAAIDLLQSREQAS
jgi:iron complex transport system substrate-binding protein